MLVAKNDLITLIKFNSEPLRRYFLCSLLQYSSYSYISLIINSAIKSGQTSGAEWGRQVGQSGAEWGRQVGQSGAEWGRVGQSGADKWGRQVGQTPVLTINDSKVCQTLSLY